jgi:hypothetical protein
VEEIRRKTKDRKKGRYYTEKKVDGKLRQPDRM